LVEIRDSIDNKPWDSSAKVNDLMDQKAQQPSSKDRIAHPDIITDPCPLQPSQTTKIDISIKSILGFSGVHDLEMRSEDGEVSVE